MNTNALFSIRNSSNKDKSCEFKRIDILENKLGGYKMKRFDNDKNKCKENILKNITWYDKESEEFKELLNNKKNKGLYFFRKKDSDDVVYAGVGGLVKQSLGKRIKQYMRPSDKGTKFFKCKVCNIKEGSTESKWKEFKNNYQGEWKEKFSEFEVGVILCNDYKREDLLIEEAFVIGVLEPIYNF